MTGPSLTGTLHCTSFQFIALRPVVLCEGDRIEETPAIDNERKVHIRAPAHLHSAQRSSLLLEIAHSPLPAYSKTWLDGPAWFPALCNS